MLQADTISNKIASLKGISFSLIKSARTRTLDGWPPLLKALISAEHATESGWMLVVSISRNSAHAFSQSPEIKKEREIKKFRIEVILFESVDQDSGFTYKLTCSII